MKDSQHSSQPMLNSGLRYSLSPSSAAAVCLLVGVWLGNQLPQRPDMFLAIAAVWISSAAVLTKLESPSKISLCLLLAMLMLGICNWQFRQPPKRHTSIRNFCNDDHGFVRLRGRITTVPVVHEAPADEFSLRRDSPPQTRFRLDVIGLITNAAEQAVSGICQIYVSGDAVGAVAAHEALSQGDEVLMTGRLTWPKPPGNPGEFDFPRYLDQQRISGQLFVVDPAAIQMIAKGSRWNPQRWISFLRHDARNTILNNVHPNVQGIALALLLGNRHQLPTELEQSFVASGTMHLLAISGLHVGILCLFLLRLANLLMAPRNFALIMTMATCVVYAMVTDLRPSVVRATVFFIVFAVGELSGRKSTIVNLLAITVVVMLMADPYLAFDTGAWLSFLAVAALGRVSALANQDEVNPEAPPDALTRWEQWRQVIGELRSKAALRYKQTLYVLAATTPLVAAAFHVISPVSLIVNVLLIPFTFVCLCAGFVTLISGYLLPLAAGVPGTIFSWTLGTMMATVQASAAMPGGHLYVADVPAWFIPAYYGLLITLIYSRDTALSHVSRVGLLTLVSVAFFWCTSAPTTAGMQVTVLDIGHGSAAVVEFEGKVVLVDAGSLSRSERTTDVVCRFLWNRGYHQVNAIVISHADMDHYNAVPGILERMPVAQIITSQQFVAAAAPSVQTLVHLAKERDIPVIIATNGDDCVMDKASLQILQADFAKLPANASDNEKSLVTSISYRGRRIVLPGDIEGEGLTQLMPELKSADLLVSPHHGSIDSNTSELAKTIQPEYVAVSARNDLHRGVLENVYSEARTVRYTSEAGAIVTNIWASGQFDVTPFRTNSTRQPER